MTMITLIHRYKILLTGFLLAWCSNVIYAQSVFDLKGQRVILAPPYSYNQDIPKESVYTLDVLRNMKISDKYLYPNTISGDTVTVTDVQHINPDNKKKEAVLIFMNHKGNDVVYHIPLYFSDSDQRAFRTYIVGKTKYQSRFWDNKSFRQATIDNVAVVYYNVDSLKVMENYLKGKYWWPVSRKNTINESIYQSDNCPYKFLNFTMEESRDYSNQAKMKTKNLHANFEMADGNIRSYELMYRKELPGITYTNDKETTISDISRMFVSEEEMRERAKSLVTKNRILIDSILSTFKGKEVYINVDKMPNSLLGRSYDITRQEPVYKSDLKNISYFTLQDVKTLPIINNRPYYDIYVVFSKERTEYAIPFSTSFFDYTMDAQSHRYEVEMQLKAEEKRMADEERQQMEEEKEYEQNLARKYGKNNAKLILQGKIRLGFTRAMVEESWGAPDDVSTITNALGSVEMWMYGIGESYVYFQNGKVTQIIN